MINIVFPDTINVAHQVISKGDSELNGLNNYWIWVAIIEFIIIILIIFRRKKPDSNKEQFKREAKEGDIDFNNIINSSFHAIPLYDELKIKCHPDRFPSDEEKNQIALELFQEISMNKTDYKKLIELKELAKQKLNINF